jgi:hypothetical protein
MTEARRRNIPFAVGGGLAAMAYAGQWRNSKDIDLYIKPEDRQAMVSLLTEIGLEDYYDRKPYDRAWIYRACRDDSLIDVIWAMANQRTEVDEAWLSGPEIQIHGQPIRILPAAETLWSKIYILQRDRSDWPDALNILYSMGRDLDWPHLMNSLGPDAPLLGSLLSAFRWLCPGKSRELPDWLWSRLGLKAQWEELEPDCDAGRARLLDSRPWFTPTLRGEDECFPEN